jgi:hypothetical protein
MLQQRLFGNRGALWEWAAHSPQTNVAIRWTRELSKVMRPPSSGESCANRKSPHDAPCDHQIRAEVVLASG